MHLASDAAIVQAAEVTSTWRGVVDGTCVYATVHH